MKVKNAFKYLLIFIQLPIQLLGQSSEKKLSIGDKMPDITLNNIVNFKTSKVRISDFKGKALIFDFWGTWCSPCIYAFPKIDSLQKKYGSDLQIMPVTTGSGKLSAHLLNNLSQIKGINIPSVVEDTAIAKLFDYQYVPHYVWIDANGIIKAFTGSEEITDMNIKAFINKSKLTMPTKIDLVNSLNMYHPFFFDNQLDYGKYKDLFLWHSILTKYNQDAGAGSSRGKNFINCPNHPIKLLYQLAFGEFRLEYIDDNRVVLEGFNTHLDSMEIGSFKHGNGSASEWYNKYEKQFSYCYELAFLDSIVSTPYMFQIMRDELNKYFGLKGIQARKEKRNVKYYALIRTSDEDKLASKGGPVRDEHTDYFIDLRNSPIYMFSGEFQYFFPNREGLAVENETGYKGNVDISINADMFDIPSVNKELEKYDLKFVKKEKEMDMIVITKIPVAKN